MCIALILPVLLTGCFRQDVVTVDISIPQMKSSECRRLVMQALNSLEHDAIKQAAPNIQTGVLQITYDSKRLALKNIEYSIAAAGFDANEEKAPAEARDALPAACR